MRSIALLICLLVLPAASLAGPKSTLPRVSHSGPLDFGVELVPPPNDQCSGAILIPCGNIDLSGNSGLATNDYSPSDTLCTGFLEQGGDVVYKVTVVAGDSLWLDYDTVFDGAIYIVTNCSNISGTCVVGRDSVNTAGIEKIRFKFTSAATYYIILDSYGAGGGGAWTAAGQLVCGSTPLPPNDICATATPLLCGPFSLSGTTQYALNNYGFPSPAASCTQQLASGRDVVYKINATAGDSLYITYTSSTNGSLYIYSTCDGNPSACVAGTDSYGPGVAESMSYKFAFSGPHYLILDSRDPNSFGTWTASGLLGCGLVTPSNDLCAGAIPIGCGDVSLSGSTERALNNYGFASEEISCTGFLADGHDVVYKVTAILGDSLWLNYTSTSDASIYVMTNCADTMSCVYGVDNNVDGEPEYMRFRFPASATYYIILDSYSLDTWGDWSAVGYLQCGAVGVDPALDPRSVAFSGVYPNPFRMSTVLEYALASEAEISLRVYDLQGRRVRSLFEGRRGAGRHRTTWDGLDDHGVAVGPGVYFAQLESDGRIAKRRLIFVR